MWLLSPFHPIRRIAIRVLAHPIFSLIVILTILANCYVMILPDSEYTNATEIVFTAIYTYESAVKVSKYTSSPLTLFLQGRRNWVVGVAAASPQILTNLIHQILLYYCVPPQ